MAVATSNPSLTFPQNSLEYTLSKPSRSGVAESGQRVLEQAEGNEFWREMLKRLDDRAGRWPMLSGRCREGGQKEGLDGSRSIDRKLSRETKPSNKKGGQRKGESRNSGLINPDKKEKRVSDGRGGRWDKRKCERQDETAIRA